MLLDFNLTLKIFIAKGEEEEDNFKVTRTPESTRPLGLKNTDNKIITSAVNNCLKHGIARDACHLQRGFLPGRHFTDNIVELDAFSRTYAMDSSLTYPVLALFDFGSAFPSLIHAWMFTVLEAVGLPQGAFNVVVAVYHFVSAIGRVAGSSSRFLFYILSGIIQGCPLAGTCFALAMDPFLQKFKLKIEDSGHGHVRACADDIGAALRSLHVGRVLAEVFQGAERFAGLMLKIKKCCIIPLNVELSETVTDDIRAWLMAHLPSWHGVRIVDVGVYLGASLGPKSASQMWTAPIAKWSHRTGLLSASSAPMSVRIAVYNSQAITALSYVSQFAILPQSALLRERALLCKLLRMPFNALGASDFFSLGRYGSYVITSASAGSLSALMRSALVTHKSWRSMHSMLQEAARMHLDMEQAFLLKRDSPRFWDSQSIAEVLHDAAHGFPASRSFSAAGAAALLAFSEASSDSSRFPKGVQKIMFDSMMPILYGTFLAALVRRRAIRFGIAPEVIQGLDFEVILEAVRPFGPFIFLTLVRTWANAWTTSHRMHEPYTRCCILGCPNATDSLSHYINCRRMWRAMRSAWSASSLPMPVILSASLDQRLAICEPTFDRVLMLCAACHSYHVLKQSYIQVFNLHIQTGNIEEVARITVEVLTASLTRFRVMM